MIPRDIPNAKYQRLDSIAKRRRRSGAYEIRKVYVYRRTTGIPIPCQWRKRNHAEENRRKLRGPVKKRTSVGRRDKQMSRH